MRRRGLREVWIELRSSMRGVLEETSLADLVERGRPTAELLVNVVSRVGLHVDDLARLEPELLGSGRA